MAFCRGQLTFSDNLVDDLDLFTSNSRDKIDFVLENKPACGITPNVTPTKFGDGSSLPIDNIGEPIAFDLELSVTPSAFTKIHAHDSGLGSPTPASFRGLSPSSRYSCSPVRLTYDDSPDEDCNHNMTKELFRHKALPRFDDDNDRSLRSPPPTPPSKKLRSLCLYDTPHTPKSLLQKAQRRITRSKPQGRNSCNKSLLDPEGPQANVNPFTPDSPTLNINNSRTKGTKRHRNLEEDLMSEIMSEDSHIPVSKKIALREINTLRYHEEFHEVEKLGDGEFGSVYKCIHRLDGCPYAIKKSKMPVAGSAYERAALNEVYAHAVLGKHQHVVRYYSAWAENDHMYIQNEFCNGGSLADEMNERSQHPMSEAELKLLLLQVADGLRYIHSQHLVHLDIKPGNIFLNKTNVSGESGIEEDLLEDDQEEELPEPTIYKIGDLGHVTSVQHPQVEEGDVRYLPTEILTENFEHLTKADIFSLALTVYQAGCISELPKNGPEWHTIRQGQLPKLPHVSDELHILLLSMLSPEPANRPSAAELLHHPTLRPMANVSKAQLKRQLNEQRWKNQILARELEQLKQKQESSMAPPTSTTATMTAATTTERSTRLIGNGKKVNRSLSVTCF